MGSSTRSALTQLHTQVSDLSGKQRPELAAELFSAAEALGSSSQLLSILADSAYTQDKKSSLLTKLFPGYSKESQELLQTIVTSSWSRNRDILTALEEAGISLATGDQGEQVVEELYALADVVSTDAALELALNDKLAQPETRAQLIASLFGKKLSAATVAITKQLVTQPRGRRFTKLIEDAAQTVAAHSGFRIAKIVVATRLEPQEVSAVEADLSKSYGTTIKAVQFIDPDVLGGIRVQVGHEVLDGTIEARLHELRLQLAS